MTSNNKLNQAKVAKNDEFYTQLVDIEKELVHYEAQLRNKVIFCNCDDPKKSNFVKYFTINFNRLGLKKLLINQQDFRSPECITLLEEADVVITNPPFSLFREYVDQLMQFEKKFLIIGNINAITYKEIFPLLKENKLWLGNTSPKEFGQPDGSIKKFGNICWFTNLKIKKRNESIILYKKYSPEEYPKYDNYDAINVDKVVDIPMDYEGPMGVPITFLGKYNPKQFEIIDGLNRYSILSGPTEETKGKYLAQVGGKPLYVRIIIKNLKVKK